MMKRTVTLILASLLLLLTIGCNATDYKKACSEMEKENYESAETLFLALGDYEDSKEKATDCRYMRAIEYLQDGLFDEAKDLFVSLGDYRDSSDQVRECQYQIALLFEKNGQNDKAEEAFAALGDYKDSATHVADCRWNVILDYFGTTGKTYNVSYKSKDIPVTDNMLVKKERDVLSLSMRRSDTAGIASTEQSCTIIIQRNPNVANVAYDTVLTIYSQSGKLYGTITIDPATYSSQSKLAWNDASTTSTEIPYNGGKLIINIELPSNQVYEMLLSLSSTLQNDLGYSMTDIGFESFTE